jgi:hypothetical protein
VSAHFAIPATTFVLRGIIEDALTKAYSVLGAGTTPPPILVGPPPPRPDGGAAAPPPEATQAILFLYHVQPNLAWRNMFDPAIDSQGNRVANAPLALDLHYIVAATGTDLEREVVFGTAVYALHRTGIVSRPLIQAILESVTPPPMPTKITDLLTTEPLDQQIEQITVTHQALDADMLSRMWTAFQSPLRPSAGFLVTTVFLDRGDKFPDAIPVSAVAIHGRPDPAPAGASPSDDVMTQVKGL